MTCYLLDTNHCVYLINGSHKKPQYCSPQERKTVEAVRNAPPSSIFMSDATLGELYFGAFKSQKQEKNLRRIENIKLIVPPIPLDEAVWKLFGETKAALQKDGKVIEDLDLLIACTAKSKGLI